MQFNLQSITSQGLSALKGGVGILKEKINEVVGESDALPDEIVNSGGRMKIKYYIQKSLDDPRFDDDEEDNLMFLERMPANVGELRSMFPMDVSNYHIRFKIINEAYGFVWCDIADTSRVPLYDGAIHSKLLPLKAARLVQPVSQAQPQSVQTPTPVNVTRNPLSAATNSSASQASPPPSSSSLIRPAASPTVPTSTPTPSVILPNRADLIEQKAQEKNERINAKSEAFKLQLEEEEKLRSLKLEARNEAQTAINKWSLNDDGRVKDIRALISTLHEVLWTGANWNIVSLGDLLMEAQLKKAIMKARLLCHPDKVSKESAEVQARAEGIFQALTEATKNM